MTNGNCSHMCVNTAGGYKCECPDPEMSLSLDNKACHGGYQLITIIHIKIVLTLESNVQLHLFTQIKGGGTSSQITLSFRISHRGLFRPIFSQNSLIFFPLANILKLTKSFMLFLFMLTFVNL